jgi:hypothetical protein
MSRFVDPNIAPFPDRVYRDVQLTATGRDASFLDGPQNPAAEVRASLQGQPAFSTAGLFYSNDRGPGVPFERRPPTLGKHHASHHRPHPEHPPDAAGTNPGWRGVVAAV